MPENHIPPEIYQLAKTYYLGEPTTGTNRKAALHCPRAALLSQRPQKLH
jgi:hypothetical protein